MASRIPTADLDYICDPVLIAESSRSQMREGQRVSRSIDDVSAFARSSALIAKNRTVVRVFEESPEFRVIGGGFSHLVFLKCAFFLPMTSRDKSRCLLLARPRRLFCSPASLHSLVNFACSSQRAETLFRDSSSCRQLARRAAT